MRCEELRSEWLSAWVDGDVDEAQRRRIEEHLAGCPGCCEEAAALEDLSRAARELPREIEPARDLWPGIAGRIAAAGLTPSRRRAVAWRGIAAAALVVAAVLVGVSVGRRSLPPAPPATSAAVPASLTGAGNLDGAIAEYARASRMLREALARRQAAMNDDTARVVFDNLAIIDGAIGRIRTALASDPGNRDLAVLLVATYQQEIELLQRATQMGAKG